MGKQTVSCQYSDCTVVNRPSHDTHIDDMGRQWWAAQCGGCGGIWPVHTILETINAACASCAAKWSTNEFTHLA